MKWRKVMYPPSTAQIRSALPLIHWAERTYEQQGNPKGFCVFVVQQQDVIAYFSPVAVQLCGELLMQLSNGGCEVSSWDLSPPELWAANRVVGDAEECGLLKSSNEPGDATQGM